MTTNTSSDLTYGFGKVRHQLDQATKFISPFLVQGNNLNDSSLNGLKKEQLLESLKSSLKLIIGFRPVIDELGEKLASYVTIERTQEYENFATAFLEKVSGDLVEKTKNEIIQALPKVIDEPPKTKKKVITPNEQTLVLDVNQKEIEPTEGSHKKSYSAALKDKLNKKLVNIPVANSAVNKRGEAILTFPSTEACLQAKSSLQTDFKVSISNRKTPLILPRLKINHIDQKLTLLDKEELRAKIVNKNEILKNATESDFQITYIDKNKNFAVAKTSPKIFHSFANSGNIYIDLCRYHITEHLHPIQCFRCQSFGHTSGSQLCNSKDDFVCLYCSKNHKSSECPNKKNKKAHNCSNCSNSKISKIKSKSNTHSSTSKSCPIYIREIEKLKEIICYDQKTYLNAKNQ